MADDPATEGAKAAGELAKASGKAIDAAREAGGFVARHIEGPLEQVMGLIEDRLRFVRWERLMQRAVALLEESAAQGTIRPVPLSFAIPLLEAGSQ